MELLSVYILIGVIVKNGVAFGIEGTEDEVVFGDAYYKINLFGNVDDTFAFDKIDEIVVKCDVKPGNCRIKR